MVSSKATTVAQYLADLTQEQRQVMIRLRTLVNQHLLPGYQETMNWGMISYEVPLSRFADTYNGKPLAFVALAAQKHHYAIYLMCAYVGHERELALRNAYAKAGLKLDMGKSCLRYTQWNELLPQAIGELIASVPVDLYIQEHEAVHGKSRARTK